MVKKYFSLPGIVLLLIGSLGPVAEINNHIISIIPIWNNFIVSDGLWNWMDISFFAISLIILLFLTVYFIFNKTHIGILISGFIILFIITIIFFAILQLKHKYAVYEEISFNLKWGWLLLYGGDLIVLLSGTKRKELSNSSSSS